MLTWLRHMAVFVLLSVVGFFFYPISTASAFFAEIEPPASQHLPFDLNLTLGKHNCALDTLDTGHIVEDTHALTYSPIIFQVPESCVAVLSRLRASVDQAVWLSLDVDDNSDWLQLHTVSTDDNPPTLDRRGRYFGCKMPENGFHTCRVGFEMKGQHYQVFVPMRVGVLKHYDGTSTLRTTTRKNTVPTTVATYSKPDDTAIVSTTRYGRGISIPSLGFYSGITTFPLANGTWQIAVEEPMVGHLEGTAWINERSNVVLGGHSKHSDGANGIFAGLYNVDVGQKIVLNDNDVERHYVVTEINVVHYQDISVVSSSHGDQLTMLTCHIPSYNPATNNYDQRLVVVAEPVS